MKVQEKQELDVSKVICMFEKLTNILKTENQVLAGTSYESLKVTYQEKSELVSALELSQKIINKDPSIIRNSQNYKREKLKQVYADFVNVRDENLKRIRCAIAVNERVADLVKSHVANDIQHAAGYEVKGNMRKNHLEISMPPLSMNETV
jgi:hypothetical protein